MSTTENAQQLSLLLGFKPLTKPKSSGRPATASHLGKVSKDVRADIQDLRGEMRQIGDALWTKLIELEGRLP
jgi:hypothetical protein